MIIWLHHFIQGALFAPNLAKKLPKNCSSLIYGSGSLNMACRDNNTVRKSSVGVHLSKKNTFTCQNVHSYFAISPDAVMFDWGLEIESKRLKRVLLREKDFKFEGFSLVGRSFWPLNFRICVVCVVGTKAGLDPWCGIVLQDFKVLKR